MEKKEWETIESQIAEIEERISEIDTEMNENGSNTELLLDLQKELDNKTKELEEKIRKQSFTLDDFLSQMQQVRNMGPLQGPTKTL